MKALNPEVFIGVSIVLAVAALVGAKVFIQRLANFKMDESAILRFMNNSDIGCSEHSSEIISAATGISAERISEVCSRSKVIKGNSKANE